MQAQIPIIHPVLDYTNVLPQQVMGGEFSYKFNLTSLTPAGSQLRRHQPERPQQRLCATATADTAVLTPANCLLRGIPGTYTRASAEVDWRRTFVTDNGQMITPFFGLRGDVASLDVDNQAGVSNYIATGQSELARVMPTAGVEYRYPFVDVEPWGTQTIEPIAQLILRPNETEIGKFPNEDAQSLVFDDSNLFQIDKFSGWDRVEGGGRVNAGIQYTAQFNRAGIAQRAVRAVLSDLRRRTRSRPATSPIPAWTAVSTRPFPTMSARVTYQPNQIYSFTARGRFDEADLRSSQRFELESRANFDRWTLQLLYGNYAPQPELGFLTPPPGHPRRRLGQADRELGPARLRPLRPLRPSIRPDAGRRRLCRRLLHVVAELAHRLHLYNRARRRRTTRSCCSSACARSGPTLWRRSGAAF